MKKILICLACVLMASGIYAQGIEFFHGTYEEVLEKARKEDKQVFVDIYTSWCGPCKMMAKNVFTLKEVGDFYNKKFVCIKLDAEKEKDHGFLKKYNVAAFPTYFWLDADGNILDTQSGMTSPEGFIRYGENAMQSDLVLRMENGRKRWENGERSLELVNEYVLKCLRRVHPEQVKGCLLDYLSTLSEKQLQEKENYILMKGFMRNPEDNIVYHALMENADIYQYYEKNADFWQNMYRMNVRAGSANRENPGKYKAHLALLESADSPYSRMYIEILSMENILFQKDFTKGIPLAMEIAAKYKDSHAYLYGQFYYTLIIAGFFDDSVTDTQLTDIVIAMAEKALEATPSKETLLYLAAAYAKKNDYKKAYELMASEPFFPAPILSTALYKHLHLKAIHHQYLDKK
ncbi:MAG: thioredoxin family protein [Odoribacter splanchnicus]